jgi:hypothetical protein
MRGRCRNTPDDSRLASLSGERRLVLALLQQALADTKSIRDEIRHGAGVLLADAAAVRFWAELVGLDGEQGQRCVQDYLHREGRDYYNY